MGEKRETASAAITVALAAGMASSCGTGPVELAPEVRTILTHRFGDSREPLVVVRDMVSASSGKERRNLERQFAQVLGMPEATYECKDFICRQLWRMGTKESIPALKELLMNPRYADMARYALERNPDPGAGKALRDALADISQPLERTSGAVFVADNPELANVVNTHIIGVINSLGARRERESVSILVQIAGFALPAYEPLIEAAVAAVGKIGGAGAEAVLAEAKSSSFPTVRKTAMDALEEVRRKANEQ